ncbi:MAG: PEGA domain-containing protein [Balneolales bacterium]|nr:PEGA domain-containing protein [Balneolales bacterium]
MHFQKIVSGLALAVCFSLTLFLSAEAQTSQLREMEIQPDPNPSGGIPISVDYPNEAYIIIRSTIPGLRFESNMDGIVEDRSEPESGRYILIIRPFSQIFTVTADNYVAGRFQVRNPQQRETSHYVIRPVEIASDLLPVTFLVEGHDDATLTVNGQVVPVNQTTRIDTGPQQIRIEKAGYRTIEETIVVSQDNVLFRYSLEGLVEERVTIRSVPEGATVYLDNIPQPRVTPMQHFMFPGEYVVRLSRTEYRDLEQQITVREGAANEFEFEMRRFVGSLSLSVVPANARVTINSQDYTGQREINLSPGTYRIVVDREGYYPEEIRVNIEEGQVAERSIRLRQRVGSLRFLTESPDAQFRLINQQGQVIHQWSGINQIRDLPVGRYQYVGSLSGYTDITGQIIIQENVETRTEVAFGEAERLAYEREQARLREQERQREIAAQQAEERRQAEARAQQERERQQRRAQARRFYTPNSFTGYGITYSQLNLNTSAFKQNIDSNIGATFSIYGSQRYWMFGMNLGINQMALIEELQNQLDDENILVMSYGMVTGPKIGLGPFDVYGGVGIEGNALFFSEFESDEHYTLDMVYELGVILMPRSWSVGLKFSMTLGLDVLDGDPVFNRTEIGIIFK